MPITNRYKYTENPDHWRQDFQKGYIEDGTTIKCNTTTTPGWTDDGWNNQYSYLFADAYDRNGARRDVGNAVSGNDGIVHVLSGSILIQKFSNGNDGNGMIMYDQENWNCNPDATNEAYWVYGAIYDTYINIGVSVLGCATTDRFYLDGIYCQDFKTSDGHRYRIYETGDRTYSMLGTCSGGSYHAAGGSGGYSYSDLACLYTYGTNSNKIHTFLSTGSAFDYTGEDGWWSSTSYTTASIKHTLSGDFDGNGLSDVATVYATSSSSVVIHVFLCDGTSFVYQGDNGWWNSGSGYAPSSIAKAGSGDFNHDGLDDIVLMYDYGGSVRFHVFLSTGSSFSYQGNSGWWDSGSGYNASSVKFLCVGDYNGDDKADVALIYDYGTYIHVHMLLSTGSSFSWQGNNGWWDSGGGYPGSNIKQAIAGNFDATRGTDLAMVYNYGSSVKVHMLLSNANMNGFDWQGGGGWWNSGTGYPGDSIVAACQGVFNNDTYPDLVLAYKYTANETRFHVLTSNGSSFTYQGDNGWWSSGGFPASRTH